MLRAFGTRAPSTLKFARSLKVPPKSFLLDVKTAHLMFPKSTEEGHLLNTQVATSCCPREKVHELKGRGWAGNRHLAGERGEGTSAPGLGKRCAGVGFSYGFSREARNPVFPRSLSVPHAGNSFRKPHEHVQARRDAAVGRAWFGASSFQPLMSDAPERTGSARRSVSRA